MQVRSYKQYQIKISKRIEIFTKYRHGNGKTRKKKIKKGEIDTHTHTHTKGNEDACPRRGETGWTICLELFGSFYSFLSL